MTNPLSRHTVVPVVTVLTRRTKQQIDVIAPQDSRTLVDGTSSYCPSEFSIARALSMEAETGCAWIPGLAVLARNDGHVACVIPAQAGIQGQ